MKSAAEICAYTNDQLTIETIVGDRSADSFSDVVLRPAAAIATAMSL